MRKIISISKEKRDDKVKNWIAELDDGSTIGSSQSTQKLARKEIEQIIEQQDNDPILNPESK